LAHISRLNYQGTSKKLNKFLANLPEWAKNGFCKYRREVKKI